jgi:hypothetical protein
METSEQQDKFIMCNSHPHKMAKKYCKNEKCKTYICNSCAIDNHVKHHEMIEKIDGTITKKTLDLLTNLVKKETNNVINQSNNQAQSTLKCMNFIFHEAKNYCKECKNFICDKCTSTHDESHQIIPIGNYFEEVKKKVENFLEFLKFSPGSVMEHVCTHIGSTCSKGEEKQILSKIDSIFDKLSTIYTHLKEDKLIGKNITLSLIDKIHKFFKKKENLFAKHKNKLNEIQTFHDKIKFEKDKTKIYEHYLGLESIVDMFITKEEGVEIKELIEMEDSFHEFLEKREEESFINIEVLENLLKEVSEVETNLNKKENSFKADIIEFLKISEEAYEEMKSRKKGVDKRIELSSFQLSKNGNEEKILAIEKPFTHCVEGVKRTFEKEVAIVNKEIIKPKQIILMQSSQINMQIYGVKKIEITPSNRQIIQSNPIISNENNPSQRFKNLKIANNQSELFFINGKSARKDWFYEDNENEYIEEEELSEPFSADKSPEKERAITTNNKYLSPQDKNKFVKKKSQSVPNAVELLSTNIQSPTKNNDEDVKIKLDIGPNKKISAGELSTISIKTSSAKTTSASSKSVIPSQTPNAMEVLKKKLELLKSKVEKANKIAPGSGEKNIHQYISLLTWEERNMIEICAVGYNTKTMFVYNCILNKIEEIENAHFKFPGAHCFLNVLPWVYLCGGKYVDSGEETAKFSKIRRYQEKKFEHVVLSDMISPRHNHTMIYFEKDNSIFAISGSKNKTCEKYLIKENKWGQLPDLNISRERCTAVVFNEEFLYVFFGFDRNINKYVNNIERLNLNSLEEWELVTPKGNQNILKKQAMCIAEINIFKTELCSKSAILICGGVNALRNDTKEVLFYDFTENSISIHKMSLPNAASFNHSSFIPLGLDDIYYNFNENHQIVKYDAKTLTFVQ